MPLDFQQSGSVAEGKGQALLKETRLATAAADKDTGTPSLPSSGGPSPAIGGAQPLLQSFPPRSPSLLLTNSPYQGFGAPEVLIPRRPRAQAR